MNLQRVKERVMKKAVIFSVSMFLLLSCNNSGNNESAGNDSVGLTNPIAIDTVKHPAGMVNQNVISTDTAAMNVQNSINKAKEAEKK